MQNNYLHVDFNTSLMKFKEILGQSKLFEDYDYHGSNISVLIELLSYMTELNTYYVNKLAQNTYIDSADVYENVHRLANYIGYEPYGFISSIVDIEITVKKVNLGEQLQIPQWYEFKSSQIVYTLTDTFNIEVQKPRHQDDEFEYIENYIDPETKETYNIFKFYVQAIQGQRIDLEYNGSDIVDNKLILPDEHTYACNPYYNIVSVIVNNYEWIRVNDLFDRIDSEHVYLFKYDKYKRPIIEFGLFRRIPAHYEKISVKLLKTLSVDGTIGPNQIKGFLPNFIRNNTKDGEWVNKDNISITNPKPSYKGSRAENIKEIKYGAKENLKAQYRNVTRQDYIGFLNSKSDIDATSVWGEKEIHSYGHTMDYNRVYISVVPRYFEKNTLQYAEIDWTIFDNNVSKTTTTIVPSGYNDEFKQVILDYIEPREIISTEKVFILPRLIYFTFDLGIKIRRPYNIHNIIDDIQKKLKFYFSPKNINFNQIIDFKDIHNFLLDTTIRDGDEVFQNTRYIDNIVFRDVAITYPPGGTYYPSGSLSHLTEFEYPVYWKNTDKEYKNTKFAHLVLEEDNVVYFYGGTEQPNVISKSTLNDIYDINEVSKMDISLHSMSFFDINQFLYIYGGISNNQISNKIYRVNKENPEVLVDTNRLFPDRIYNSAILKVNEYIYFYGGSTDIDNNIPTNKIYRAHINFPDIIQELETRLPVSITGTSVVLLDDNIYMIGGKLLNGLYTHKIYKATVENPMHFVDTKEYLPIPLAFSVLKRCGKHVYLFGGENSYGYLKTIYRTRYNRFPDVPYKWELVDETLPYEVADTTLLEANDNYYIMNNQENDNIIFAHILGNILYSPKLLGSEVNEPNIDHHYPHYTMNKFDERYDNKFRPIKLGFNDYPVLALELCRFTEEI